MAGPRDGRGESRGWGQCRGNLGGMRAGWATAAARATVGPLREAGDRGQLWGVGNEEEEKEKEGAGGSRREKEEGEVGGGGGTSLSLSLCWLRAARAAARAEWGERRE